MRNISICLILATLIANLSSCSDVEDPGAPRIIKGSSLSANTPVSLRAIERNQLVLDMSIDGETRRYNGSDFRDDVWSIELDLQNDTTHTIDLKWYALDHLLLHEYGEFFTDSTNPEIQLDLEFADEGTGNFDDDCDGISNLEELVLGTDAGAAGSGVCPADETLDGVDSVYLVRNFFSFEQSGYRSRVTSLEQSINVRAAELSRKMWFWSRMTNDEPFETATEVYMSLAYSESLQKYVYFEIDNDTIGTFQELTSTCGPLGTTGHYCLLPFNWETDRWYTLKLELVDLDVWQASVIDQLTEETRLVGKIEVTPELEWHRPRTGLSYELMGEDLDDNNASYPRIAMQAKSANANGVLNVEASGLTVSGFVDGVVGWRAGTKSQDGINTYTLSIGDGR